MTSSRGEPQLEVVTAQTPRAPQEPVGAGGGDEPSFSEYLDVLVQHRWLVGITAAIAAALGVAYALVATPIYRADALVQVEDKKSAPGFLSDLMAFGEGASPAETEIEILRSRAIVGDVVDDLRLDHEARPRRVPLLGAALARRHDAGEGPAPAFLGLSGFGWGGERILVDRLGVPRDLQGQPLTLVAGEGGRFTLLDSEDEPLLEGQVGTAAAGRRVEIFVSALVARPGTRFDVTNLDRDEVVADLQRELRIVEKGKKTGILQLALEGEEPARIADVLDAITRAYVRQNVERKSAEAEKTLVFLEEQLPQLRAKLDAAESELEAYRATKGSVDVSMEAKAALDRAVEIEKSASRLELERAALRQKFTESHPAVVAVADQLRRVEAERAALEAQFKKLPAAELESARRMRDVKVANELYITLLNKAQELKVVKEGTIGNVRILDSAVVPAKPVAPRKGRVIALALLLGLAGGVALAFGRRALDQGVQDPESLEREFGIGVHASVPLSDRQRAAHQRARPGEVMPVLARESPDDLAVESLRSLRTSLQFELLEAKSNVITISGPAPGVGKSFVSVNLGHLLGDAGKRVVIVDADLRRGHLHQYYGGDRAKGLSDVIIGDVPLAEALRTTQSPNVTFLSTGAIPPNPAELLASERFARVLQQLSSGHDLVLLDTPPILAVTDAALVGRVAGVNLLVVREGRHPLREIAAALRALGRGGARVHGFVMNCVQLERGLGRKSAYHYQYKY